MDAKVFTSVRYHISLAVGAEQRRQLTDVLNAEGAEAVLLTDSALTHFVTTSLPADDVIEALPPDSTAHLVTPVWVERSRILGSQQPPEFYSPDPALLFSGIVAAATDLSKADLELLSAAITALGGQWRTALTRDVTHLFALSSGSVKYETAMHFRDKTGMCVLVPHWFDDSVRLGIRGLPTEEYEWPEPRVFRAGSNSAQEDGVADAAGANVQKTYKLSSEKKLFYETALSSNNDFPFTRAPTRNLWNGLRILLSASLGLSESQRDAHEADIRRGGGEAVTLQSGKSGSLKEIAEEETKKVEETDVLVTRYRTGAAYVKAYKQDKTIGSLSWLWFVRSSGTLSRPTDQLLHYPIPMKPIEGFSSHIITITNYTGKDREYLKKLITTMGAEFTPSMSGKNTVVIAAYIEGTKTSKALSWSIPVVNHTWLEDCFVQWRTLTPAHEKYICFPPGVDFSKLLAERKMGRIGFSPGELEALEEQGDAQDQMDTVEGLKDDEKRQLAAPLGTSNSARDAREVEDVVTLDEAGDVSVGAHLDFDMDIDGEGMDVDGESPRGKRREVKSGPILPSARKGKAYERAQRNGEEQVQASSSVSPTKSVRKNLVTRYGRSGTKGHPPSGSSTGSEEEVTQTRNRSPTRASYKPKPKHNQRHQEQLVDEDTEGSDIDVSVPPPKKKQTALRKYKPTGQVGFNEQDNRDVHMDVDENVRGQAGNPSKGKTTQSKGRKQVGKSKLAPAQSETEAGQEEEEIDDPNARRCSRTTATASHVMVPASVEPATPSRTVASPAKSSRTPRRQVSVLLPTVAAVYSSPSQAVPESGRTSSPAKPVNRMNSIRVEAAEEALHSPSKRGRPSISSSTNRTKVGPTSAVSSLPDNARRSSVVSTTKPRAGPSRTGSSPMTLIRSPSKRSAASKATQKLRDVVMPDVVNFQKEMKRGAVRSTWESQQTALRTKTKGQESEIDEELNSTKEKLQGKKRVFTVEVDADTSDDGPETEGQRRKSVSTKKGGVKTQGNDQQRPSKRRKSGAFSDEESEGSKSRRTSGGKTDKGSGVSGTKASSNRTNPKNVRIMTTQVSISDDVTRILTRMGVKMTTKPSECTHLIARSLVRTEKFLCAMAVAPYVVSEKWLLSSAATKQLLPEEDYLLRDPENEQKYGFKLSEALQRAKASGGKLFAGKAFYVTPKVPTDAKLLKNVVTAGGGQVRLQINQSLLLTS
ncbi:hypothetical protein AcV5_003952 [Taiwanofungus camphoratus]|nr:hypothetical protein AcV5_003952 [Antrodia cinnamomea]